MKRPNFLFIMTDTQATNMVGCYSGKPLNTQNIDSLAAEGIRFNSAYTCSPVCTPARAGLFTGIYANQSGPWTNNVAPGKNISTMGRYFKDAGYHTCYIGKWHLDGHDYFGTGECPPEWDADYWFDGANYLSELTEKEISLWRNGLNSVEDLQANHIDETFTWAHRISNRAVDFLQQPARADEPFLMVISYDEPHHPFTCPVEYLEKYTDFTTNWVRKQRMTWRTNRNITAYGRRRCHRQSVMTGFITIRSILPAMTLLMTKSDGSSTP